MEEKKNHLFLFPTYVFAYSFKFSVGLGSNKNLPASIFDKHNNYVKALPTNIEKGLSLQQN